jgi:hypothetical protein
MIYIPVVKMGSPVNQKRSLSRWMLYSYNLHHMRHMMMSVLWRLHSAHYDVNCYLNWS